MLIYQISPSFVKPLPKELFSLLQVMGASLFIALCSQISIPLFFSPVPLSAQTFAMTLIGATLGSKKAAWSVLAYLAEGGLGLPFFAGGSWGFVALLGPTGGYFLGFIIQAYLTGRFFEKQPALTSLKTISSLYSICLLQLSMGTLWLGFMLGNFTQAISLGFLPFLIGEFLKVLLLTPYLNRASSRSALS